MIDQLRFARINRCLCQFTVIAKHIDQRRFSHIAPANESILWPIRFWTFFVRKITDEIFGRSDFHEGCKIIDKAQGSRLKVKSQTHSCISCSLCLVPCSLFLVPCALCLVSCILSSTFALPCRNHYLMIISFHIKTP